MNRASRQARLRVEADLAVEIDGRPARLEGQGSQLHLILGRRETLYPLLDSSIPFARQVADSLAALGLTLTVSDGRRPLFRAGHDISSWLNRLATGSRHIAPATFWSAFDLLIYYGVRRRFFRTQG